MRLSNNKRHSSQQIGKPQNPLPHWDCHQPTPASSAGNHTASRKQSECNVESIYEIRTLEGEPAIERHRDRERHCTCEKPVGATGRGRWSRCIPVVGTDSLVVARIQPGT